MGDNPKTVRTHPDASRRIQTHAAHGERPMTEIREQKVPANGLNFHVRSAGDPADPAVILLHGFPECGYSWRYQMPFLAAKGFHVLAPDLRGYGFSDAPKAVDAYRQDKLVAESAGEVRRQTAGFFSSGLRAGACRA